MEGPRPGWDGSEGEIDRRYRQLEEIPRPVEAEEAAAPAACFGPDDDWRHVLRVRWGDADRPA